MSKRIKFTQAISRSRAEEILGEIATLTLESNQQKIEMDRGITEIRERYEHSLSGLGKAIEEKTALLEAWASANPEEFPKHAKSLSMVHGLIGFRTGMPKLKTLFKRTWDSILDTLLDSDRDDLVRVKKEVNKELVISEHAQGRLNDEQLKELGMKIVQDETFFVQPKLEDLETRSSKEAA